MKTEDKNFYLGIINGALYIFACVFISGNIVMPIFLFNFTSSKALIGLASAILSIGWYLPQFFQGYYAEKKPTKMPIYKFTAWIRTISFVLIIFAILIFANMGTNLAITVILILIFIYSFSGGMAGIVFMDIAAKTVPPQRRGYYFGGRSFFGGLLALGGSLIVSFILGHKENYPFPFNFVILFSIAFVLLSLSLFSFMMVKEPPSEVVKIRSFKEYYKEAIESLKSNFNYRRLIVTRYLCGATSIAFPFYVIYGLEVLKFPGSIIGAFLLSQVLGGIISNLFWGYLGEKKGNKLILQVFAILSLSSPIIAILSSYFEVWRGLYIFVFLFLGFAESGSYVGFYNFLLEISPAEKRPSQVGFMHTFISPVFLIPALGGFLLDKIPGNSYNIVFVLAFLFGLFGLLTTFRLVEPRTQKVS
ncbi:MAG: MFS transporter [Candidatus Firestonebacteria bacterium]